jgi:hypothetical protein
LRLRTSRAGILPLFLAEDLENLLGDMSTELEEKSGQEKIEGIEDLISCLELGLKI